MRVKQLLTAFALGSCSLTATAAPFLQLDIEGGFYDLNGDFGNQESVVTTESTFTLYTLAERNKKLDDATLLADNFYLSVALEPKDGLQEGVYPDLGTFTVTGPDGVTTTVAVTADMMWGVPPLESDGGLHDGGDLGSHDIFDTYFSEFEFQFGGSNESGVYNVQDNAGGVVSGTGMYYESWLFDISDLAAGYNLHFDLYNQRIKRSGDIDIDFFAPFSKDAGTAISSVPNPNSFALLLLGLLLLKTRRQFA